MLTLVELVEILHDAQAVSPVHLNRLRRIAEVSPTDFTPRIALRWLVEQQQLTLGQAERLVMSVDPELASSLREQPDAQPLPLEDVPRGRDLATMPVVAARESLPVAARAAPPTPLVASLPALDLTKDDPLANLPNAGWAAPPNNGPTHKPLAGNWDSPLMLVGGGSLLLLLIVGTALWFTLGRESGDELLRQADDDVRQGAFEQALFKYDRFLEAHNSHPRASYARVHRATTRLRRAVDTTTDWNANLVLAEQTVAEITGESSFAEARAELAALLPRIAEQLAKQAVERAEEPQLTAARQALELLLKPQLIPEALRPTNQLQEIEQLLRVAERRQQRAAALNNTLNAIRTSAQSGDFAAGFAAQRQLLRAYPDLNKNPQLSEASHSLVSGLRGAVRSESLSVSAEKTEPTTVVTRAVTPVLYDGVVPASTAAAPEHDTAWVVMPVDGAAVAFDVSTGRALWRRFIGRGGHLRRLDDAPRGDLLLVDAVHNAVLRCEGATGAVRWRAVYDAPIIAPPVLLRDTALIATTGGSLYQLAIATGSTQHRWHLPQEIATAPIVDPTESFIYVVADHSHLYILSRAQQPCVEIVMLGHALGQIIVPPLLIGRQLFVAQNQTSDAGLLRSWNTDSDGLKLQPLASQPYRGLITTPLVAQGRMMATITERGALSIYEIGVGDAFNTLRKVVELPADAEPPTTRYLHLHGSQLTISGYDVTLNELQVSRGRLSRSWGSRPLGTIVAPPQMVAGRAVYVCRDTQRGRWTVVGDEPISGGKSWSASFASPVQTFSAPQSKQLRSVLATGNVVSVTQAGDKQSSDALRELTRYPLRNEITARVVDALPLDESRLLLRTSDEQLWYDAGSTAPAQSVRTEVPAAVVSFAGNVLVPRLHGEIEALRPSDWSPALEPFQPSLTPGSDYRWTAAALAADQQSWVVGDRLTSVYRVGIQSQPRPHLAALCSTTLNEPLESLTIAGDTLFGRLHSGRIVALDVEQLRPLAQWDLSVNSGGGPWRAGQRALVLSRAHELCCLARDQIVWQVAWPHGALAGEPLVETNHALLATRGGTVWRVDLQTGRIATAAVVGQPLLGAPLRDNGQLVVTTTDGTLLWIDDRRSTP